jgi:ATP-dependent exoDNAse (exonuclease V) beta subunit
MEKQGMESTHDALEIECRLRTQWQIHHLEIHKLEHEAIEKAANSVKDKLEAMNQLRDQIQTERGSYIQRETFNTTLSSVDTRLKLLEQNKSRDDGRTNQSVKNNANIVWLIGALLTVINIAVIYITRKG